MVSCCPCPRANQIISQLIELYLGGVPWCYHKHRIVEPQCVVAEPLRIDCARFNERECSAVGCCWVRTSRSFILLLQIT